MDSNIRNKINLLIKEFKNVSLMEEELSKAPKLAEENYKDDEDLQDIEDDKHLDDYDYEDNHDLKEKQFDPDLEDDTAGNWLDNRKTANKQYDPDDTSEDEDEEDLESPKTTQQKPSKYKQPTPEEIQELRNYTVPWARKANDTLKLQADAKKNPVLAHQGKLVESREKNKQSKQQAFDEFKNSPKYKNADFMEQMELEDNFHKDYLKNNPDHIQAGMQSHDKAFKEGAKAHDIHAKEQQKQMQHVLSGGIKSGNESGMSLADAAQSISGNRGDDDSPSQVSSFSDKATSFANRNEDFIQHYNENQHGKVAAPTYEPEESNFDEEEHKDFDVNKLFGNKKITDPKTLQLIEQYKKEKQKPKAQPEAESEIAPSDFKIENKMPKNQKVEDFIAHHYPLVNFHANNTLKRLGLDGQEHELDTSALHEAGMHGLMHAINDYDHNKGTSFATHASNKVKGMMLNALSSQDSVPRALRQAKKEYDKKQNSMLSTADKSTDKPKIKAATPEEYLKQGGQIEKILPKSSSRNVQTPPPIPHDVVAASKHSKAPEIMDRLNRIDGHRIAINSNKGK